MPPRLTKAPRRAATTDPGRAVATAPRPTALALARVHLRLGALALARTELEILAADRALDAAGQVDLAEVRWRLGDLAGAGAAATAAIEAGAGEPVVLVIAAEAAAALGRPNEARRLANLALEHAGGPIDAVFAGMPRSGAWPADADEPPPTAATLFHHEALAAISLRAGDTDPGVAAARATAREEPEVAPSEPSQTLGLWDADDAGGHDGLPGDLPDPNGELAAGNAALVSGDLDEAALRLALALRLAPGLAPAVLEATEGASSPGLNVVRGDAYRQVGLEPEARRAYAAAVWSGARDRRGGGGEPRPASPGAAPDTAGAREPGPDASAIDEEPTASDA